MPPSMETIFAMGTDDHLVRKTLAGGDGPQEEPSRNQHPADLRERFLKKRRLQVLNNLGGQNRVEGILIKWDRVAVPYPSAITQAEALAKRLDRLGAGVQRMYSDAAIGRDGLKLSRPNSNVERTLTGSQDSSEKSKPWLGRTEALRSLVLEVFPDGLLPSFPVRMPRVATTRWRGGFGGVRHCSLAIRRGARLNQSTSTLYL